MGVKVCIKCGKEFPLTTKYFHTRKKSNDGFYNTCKLCSRKLSTEYREDNKEYLRIKGKEKYEANKKLVSEERKRHYVLNKENILQQKKQYYEINKDLIIGKRKLYCEENKANISISRKRYYLNKKEKFKKYNKEYQVINKNSITKQRAKYYQENREIHSLRHREYVNNNRQRINVLCQRRRAIKTQLPATLTIEQWENAKNYFNNKCAYCGKELPLTQDHLIPLSKYGSYTHNNIIPACISCNCSKGNKDFLAWYPVHRYYSKGREKLILKYLI